MPKKRMIFLFAAIALLFAAVPGIRMIAAAVKKEKAYKLMVDGEVWATVRDQNALAKMLDKYQQGFLKNIDKNAKVKKVTFAQKVEVVEVEVSPEAIESLTFAKKKIYAVAEDEVKVQIKSGDNLWDLAQANNITVNELEILNPMIDPEKIFPGDKLVVKPVDPELDVIVELENTIVETIPFKNEYYNNNNLYKNYRKTMRRGVEGEKEVQYHITLRNGYQSFIEIKDEKVTKDPVNAIVHIGTKTTVSMGGRVNFGVVSGKRISSRYGYRTHPITGRKRFHDGLDIAAPQGNLVYAYTDGRVIQAGWNGGYGLQVLIDHGDGLKTRYAHLSKISVRIGQRVKTGDRIGLVGSTGNSTGPHLHFEVIKNGKTKNPLNNL